MKKLFFIVILMNSSVFAEDKTALCSACHGPEGISANAQWPNLAGQNTTYFVKQIKDMTADTHRSASMMAGFLATLSPQDVDDLAAYYAKMPIAQGVTPKNFVPRGEQLYRGGDLAKHIPACIACHGPKGTGNAQAGFPLIAGQHADYTIAQLKAFKTKSRTNDFHHIMQDISSKMSDEDIEAIAYYIQGLY